MRVLVQHRSTYRYPQPAALGPHLFRLRPCNHTQARIESYRLAIAGPHRLYWQQDPHGNHVARATFPVEHPTDALDVLVEVALELAPINPFDFLVDPRCKTLPFTYPDGLAAELRPFLDLDDPAYARGARGQAFLAALPTTGDVVDAIVACNAQVAAAVRYVIREEAGVWTPEETLAHGRGSCRDSAVLLVAALRARGLAARFVSGYLIQLADEGMIPDQPRGLDRDVVDLHAWAEVYLPGAGWIGLDATSGLLCGEGHVPLCAVASPAHAAPLDGTSDTPADQVSFATSITRLGHEPRPTAPYPDEVWTALLAAADRADAALIAAGLDVTVGGEPTFTSREHPTAAEWNGAALGPSKWRQGRQLAQHLLERLIPGGAMLVRMGKHYPGESLPRWAIELIGRRDGVEVWPRRELSPGVDVDSARRLIAAIAIELGLDVDGLAGAPPYPAYEDPWRLLQDEAALPVGVDPRTAGLGDPLQRQRLARLLDRGAGEPVGWVLPLGRRGDLEDAKANAIPIATVGWRSDRWSVRREHLFLVPGDSPIGLRLPLDSLGQGAPPPAPREEPTELDPRQLTDEDGEEPRPDADPSAPREALSPEQREAARKAALVDVDPLVRSAALRRNAYRQLRHDASDPARARWNAEHPPILAAPPVTRDDVATATAGVARKLGLRTALTIEPRDGELRVFLPPVTSFADWLALIAAIDRARVAAGLDCLLEGYPPPSDPNRHHFAVTPDPGVLEVNVPPTSSGRAHAELLEVVFDAALRAGLTAEKYLLDGRPAGSGGGHHITVGAPTPLASPFLRRPALLASLITFAQHHPALSYLFAGLFVGPTSQAPRVDEARQDTLPELELALDRAHAAEAGAPTPPWLCDALFRHLLTDLTGSTHRTEISIDKLWDPQTPYGRQGLVELRCFEMPPHPRLATAQVILVRALCAAFAQRPYRAPLIRWGAQLHDRFLLPTFLTRDLLDILAYLADAGLALAPAAYLPFVDLRCPRIGTIGADGLELEVFNALEPWNVLGEELTAGGTARFVDSSLERIELRATGLTVERHVVIVNGVEIPMRPGHGPGVTVAGVRFRAWSPPHTLQPHLGVHHPLRIEVVDGWARRSLAAGTYHVWHPEGRAFDTPPLTRFEASARRAQRFTLDGGTPAPIPIRAVPRSADLAVTVDLRRLDLDHALPRADDWPGPFGEPP